MVKYIFYYIPMKYNFRHFYNSVTHIWLPGKGHMLSKNEKQLRINIQGCTVYSSTDISTRNTIFVLQFENLIILYENSIFLTGMRTKSDRR